MSAQNQLTGGELVSFITGAARASQREGCVDGLNLTLTQFKVTHLLDSADGELWTSELAPSRDCGQGRRAGWMPWSGANPQTARRAMVIGE